MIVCLGARPIARQAVSARPARVWQPSSRLDCRGRARRSLVGHGDAGCGLQRRAEGEETAAERNRADREPRPSESEARNDVREPMDSEHHAAARDCHRDRRRRPRDEGTCARCSTTRQHERHRRIEAAAVAEWPLGNDGPSVAAAGLKLGRTLSSACLIVVTRTISPTTTRRGTPAPICWGCARPRRSRRR